jgi:hypothetical protein
VLQNIAKVNMGVMSAVFWIRAMKSQLGAYTAMPRFVGERKQ